MLENCKDVLARNPSLVAFLYSSQMAQHHIVCMFLNIIIYVNLLLCNYYHILLPDAGRIQQAQLNDLTKAGKEITTTTTVKNLLIFDIIIE